VGQWKFSGSKDDVVIKRGKYYRVCQRFQQQNGQLIDDYLRLMSYIGGYTCQE